ncbi:unnamed protein product [Cuscuta campestris]|uniref:Chromo domain-containing protein n=1 Tax=Cuscuta campestris TaxID=132261 RepID=A0A484LHI6_9ASTE|nr:unnamed protein product [Cuscuta campestris]
MDSIIISINPELLTLSLLFLPCFLLSNQASALDSATKFINVASLGAKRDGKTDASQALRRAWSAACGSRDPVTIYIPDGTFFVRQGRFAGPCRNTRIEFRIRGTLLAPADYNVIGSAGSWLAFEQVDGVSAHGGELSGQGAAIWACKRSGEKCPNGATAQVDGQIQTHSTAMQQLHQSMQQIQRDLASLLGDRRHSDGHHDRRGGGNGDQGNFNPMTKMKLDMPKSDGSDPLGWLFKAHEYFVFYGVPEESRLAAVCLMLEGPALDWLRWRQRNGLLHSWTDFVTSFKLRFDPLNYVDYFGLLSKVRQMGSVLDYQQAFEKVLVNVTDVDESNLQSLFYAGLKSHLQHDLMLHKPSSLSESFALARELEAKHAAWATSLGSRPSIQRQWPVLKPPAATTGQPLLPTPEPKEDEDEDAAPDLVDETLLMADVSTLNSMAGVAAPRSLRLSGMIVGGVVDVLIDGGSTHNFIHPSLVERLQLPITSVPAFRVYVGNGASLLCNQQCVDIALLLQGVTFNVDVFVLPIHGPDVVLGVQWLQLLGKVTHDYANLTMDFVWKGSPVTLKGGTPSLRPITLHHCQMLYVAQDLSACFELFLGATADPDTTPDPWPEGLPLEIMHVLQRFQTVFAIPTVLRPFRGSTATVQPLPLPDDFVDGRPPSVPVAIHAVRRVLRNGSSEEQFLVSWSDGTLDDATWEPAAAIRQHFPELHLEDKNLSFTKAKNILVSGVTSQNSQMFHVVINGCHNVTLQHIQIAAPADSPNTDGIHVQFSSAVTLRHSAIATGDDCVSIGPGTANLSMQNLTCGPGHGISIGSLGRDKREEGVENVTLEGGTLKGTQNGVRIKAWGKPSNGFVKSVVFKDLTMVNVLNPILIDQNYCPRHHNCPRQASGVRISDVTYEDIKGTSASEVAVKFECSKVKPCKGITMKDVKLSFKESGGGNARASCAYAAGMAVGLIQPSSCL